jgi:hypothetical protein
MLYLTHISYPIPMRTEEKPYLFNPFTQSINPMKNFEYTLKMYELSFKLLRPFPFVFSVS